MQPSDYCFKPNDPDIAKVGGTTSHRASIGKDSNNVKGDTPAKLPSNDSPQPMKKKGGYPY